MKILKYILIFLAVLVGIALLLGLILPKDFDVHVTEKLDIPSHIINRNISDFKQWPRWMPWLSMDPNMKFEFDTKHKGQGAEYAWKGEKSGAGRMSIDTLIPRERMRTRIHFDGMGTSHGYWDFNALDKQTELTWGLKTHVNFPFNALFYFQQSSMKTSFSEGLKNLESICKEDLKNGLKYGDQNIHFSIFDQKNIVGIQDTLPMDQIADFFSNSYQDIYKKIADDGLQSNQAPLGLYYEWNEDSKTTHCVAAVSLKNPSPIATFQSFNIPNIKALKLTMMGGYDQSYQAHEALGEAAKDLGVNLKAPVVERYLRGPVDTDNENEYKTEIYYLYEL